VTYGKSATLLSTLEGMLGHDTMDKAMRTYFQRYRFTHPTTEDFLRTIEEVAIADGKAVASSSDVASLNGPRPLNIPGLPESPVLAINSSLRPFFNQAVYGTQVLDYAVDGVSSEPISQPGSHEAPKQYLSTVNLRRKGDFILPVSAEIVFEDGSRTREHWDGVDRWIRFSYTRNAKIVSVEIDPEHIIPLDRDLFNNSRSTHPDAVPGNKLAAIWLTLQQFAQQLLAWIV
jgi:hypothetical protein